MDAPATHLGSKKLCEARIAALWLTEFYLRFRCGTDPEVRALTYCST